MKYFIILFLFLTSFLFQADSAFEFSKNLDTGIHSSHELLGSINKQRSINQALANSLIPAGPAVNYRYLHQSTEGAVFAVDSVNPEPNQKSIAIDSSIIISFNESINENTVNSNTCAIFGSFSGIVSGTFSKTSANTIRFTPDSSFYPGETVSVILTKRIENQDNNALVDSFNWQFITGGVSGPGNFLQGQSIGDTKSNDLSLGDLNKDGFIDVFFANEGKNEVWLNDGNGNFSLHWVSDDSNDSRAVALGDIDGDDDLDAFIANDGENFIWLNNGNGTFIDSGQSITSRASRDVALGDINGDGHLDAIVTNFEDANIISYNDGTGNFSIEQSFSNTNSKSNGHAIGDLNNDGHLDIFIANTGSNEIWTNDGDGTLTPSWTSEDSMISYNVELVDLNNNQFLDAFVANGNANNEVWLNNGNNTFGKSSQNIGDNTWSTDIVLNDFNGNGNIDAFVANGILANPNSFWANDGDATFADSSQSLGQSSSLGAAGADLNGDGTIDVMTAEGGANQIWFNASPGITLISPESGENWSLDSEQTIQWTSFNVNSEVAIRVSYNGGADWTNITTGTSNDGMFTWTVNGYPTEQAMISVSPTANPELGSVSDAFQISSPPPAAYDDYYDVNQNMTLEIPATSGLLRNDTYYDITNLCFHIMESPTQGSLNLNDDGSFTYTPVAGYSGDDYFTYTISDGINVSNIATVTITIIYMNTPPVAHDDNYTVNANESLVVNQEEGVIANDTDIDSDLLTPILAENTSHGVLVLNNDGSFHYTPDAEYSGYDTFTYKSHDGTEYSNKATVLIHVENKSPIIKMQPADIDLIYGEDASFEISAESDSEISIEWQFSADGGVTWTTITGADDYLLLVETPSIERTKHQFRAECSNSYGTAITSAAELTVNPRPITITASNQTKIYGEDDPPLGYIITEGTLVGSDNVSGSLIRNTGENVGAYTINQGTLSLNHNYSITFIEANLVIEPREASVIPENKSKFLNDPDPALTGTLSGFLSNDHIAVSYSRSPGEIIGNYDIFAELSPPEKLLNYNITYHTGTFSIVKDPTPSITVLPADQSIIYGENAQFSAVASGNPSPSIQWQLSTDGGNNWMVISGAKNTLLNISKPSVDMDGYLYRAVFNNDHGLVSTEPAKLTVTRKVVIPVVTVQDKVYDGFLPATIISKELQGLIDGDNVYLICGQAVFNTKSVGDNKTVEIYDLELSGPDAHNYMLESTSTLTQASILAPIFDGDDFDLQKLTGTGILGNLPYIDNSGNTLSTGKVITHDGHLEIIIEADTSLINSSELPISSLSVAPIQELPEIPGQQLLLAYQLGPRGSHFNPGISLEFNYEGVVLPDTIDDTDLYIGYWDGTKWNELNCQVDTNNKTATVLIEHFSIFGLLATVPPHQDSETPLPTSNPPPTPTDNKPTTKPDSDATNPAPISEPTNSVFNYFLAAFFGALGVGIILLLTRPR